MTPGVAASSNEAWAAASSLATRSAGSAFVDDAAVAGVDTTLPTSLTHVDAGPAAVLAAAVLPGSALLDGEEGEPQAARATNTAATTAPQMGLA
jgi:hypothetical protein